MKMNKTFAALAIMAACLGTGSQTVWAQASGHDHSSRHAAEVGHLKFNNGKKWIADANLRLGMARIRDALAAEAIHSGKMPAKQYQAFAQKVTDQVSFMVQNCKLDKEADAALHLILADLIAGADLIFASGDEHSRRQGVEKISGALEDYATCFEHPGWHGAE